MASRNHRPSVSSVSDSPRKVEAAAAKSLAETKRPVLADITNREIGSRAIGSLPKPLVPCSAKNAQKKGPSVNNLSTSASKKLDVLVPYEDESDHKDDLPSIRVTILPSHGSTISQPRVEDASPKSVDDSVSRDETMSTCDSLNCSEFEHMDNEDAFEVKSVEWKKSIVLDIPFEVEKGKVWERDVHVEMKSTRDDYGDPRLCATIASDIYKHLRASEEKRRPSFVYMESLQRDVTSSMRAILIDWLVEVAEEYRLVPETLYLAVNYIDRYLSRCAMSRKQLQLLGVACMMIAAKYEEIHVPMVEEFCYVTDNTYSKEEVLQMEYSVLNLLNFDMAVPTAHCFLRLFIHAAQKNTQGHSVKFECLACYVTELSLVEYHMLRYAPSLIAASATFLARFMLSPSKKPWNSTLREHTLYKPSELSDCVKALHRLCLNNGSGLPAVREKFSQHKFKFVAKKYCPITIPTQHFQD